MEHDLQKHFSTKRWSKKSKHWQRIKLVSHCDVCWWMQLWQMDSVVLGWAQKWMQLSGEKEEEILLVLPSFSEQNTMPPGPLMAVPSKVSRKSWKHLNFRWSWAHRIEENVFKITAVNFLWTVWNQLNGWTLKRQHHHDQWSTDRMFKVVIVQ